MAKLLVSVPKHLQNKVGPSKKEGGYDGSKFGVRTGLRMTHFADALLMANEAAKVTDEELNEALAAEFPKRETKKSGVKGVPTVQAISAYRAYFNAGKHGHNSRLSSASGEYNPNRKLDVSHSYNAEGVARAAISPAPKATKAKKGKGKASKGKGKATPKKQPAAAE